LDGVHTRSPYWWMFFELSIVAWRCCGRDFDIAGSQSTRTVEAWNGLVSTPKLHHFIFVPDHHCNIICQSSIFLFLSSFDSKHSFILVLWFKFIFSSSSQTSTRPLVSQHHKSKQYRPFLLYASSPAPNEHLRLRHPSTASRQLSPRP
jgi:hypothetical protein